MQPDFQITNISLLLLINVIKIFYIPGLIGLWRTHNMKLTPHPPSTIKNISFFIPSFLSNGGGLKVPPPLLVMKENVPAKSTSIVKI